jgi:uncharacterized Zn finger protein (UPF0148 family)
MACTCPNCSYVLKAPAPPKGRRTRLTPEEQAQRHREASRRYYNTNRVHIQEARREYMRQRYQDNREAILERRRLKRFATKVAKAGKTAMVGECELPPGPKAMSKEAFLEIPEDFRQDASYDSGA